MSTLLGTGQIRTLTGAALGCTALTGYVSPNMQSLKANHKADVKTTKGQNGKTTTAYYSDEQIELTFDVIPEGTTPGSAIVEAKKSAGLPAVGSAFTITGLPIIVIGAFTDGLNTNGTSTQPWIYEGGGTISGEADEKWTLSLPLKRYEGITSGTAISA